MEALDIFSIFAIISPCRFRLTNSKSLVLEGLIQNLNNFWDLYFIPLLGSGGATIHTMKNVKRTGWRAPCADSHHYDSLALLARIFNAGNPKTY